MLLKILTALTAVCLPLSGSASGQECSKVKNELNCVLASYPLIYQESSEYFWSVLNHVRESALGCSSMEATTDFLRLASLPNPGADLEEFISEGIEKLCTSQPVCFKEAIGKLDTKNREAVTKKLENPTYFDVGDLVGCYEKR